MRLVGRVEATGSLGFSPFPVLIRTRQVRRKRAAPAPHYSTSTPMMLIVAGRRDPFPHSFRRASFLHASQSEPEEKETKGVEKGDIITFICRQWRDRRFLRGAGFYPSCLLCCVWIYSEFHFNRWVIIISAGFEGRVKFPRVIKADLSRVCAARFKRERLQCAAAVWNARPARASGIEK